MKIKAFCRLYIIHFFCIITILACIMTAVVATAEKRTMAVASLDMAADGEKRAALSEAETALAARFIAAECRERAFICKISAAAVLLNRKQSPYFPDTLVSIIFDAESFESIRSGSFYDGADGAETESARRALMLALDGQDPTGGATAFAPKGTDGAARIKPFLVVGGMVFGERR